MADTTGTQGADVDDAALPEFRIVVERPRQGGPLAPYRLVISIAVVMVVLGPSLYSMVLGQSPDDIVLMRAGGIGLLVWITTGIVSSALGSVARSSTSRSSGPPTA